MLHRLFHVWRLYLNREERFTLAADSLGDARILNRSGIVILVEGKRDVHALHSLGFSGPIEQLNRGWPVDRVAVYLAEEFDEPPIVLMDWDRTGGRLQRTLVEALMSLDVNVSDEPRRTLSKSMRPDTLCVEDLDAFAEEILPKMNLRDPEGAK